LGGMAVTVTPVLISNDCSTVDAVFHIVIYKRL